MQKILEIAKNEIGYHDDNGISKYTFELFPLNKHIPWCLIFIEWVFIKAHGIECTIEMLHLIDGNLITSVSAFVSYIKYANHWHKKMIKPGWLLFLRMNNEWTNHVELIIGVTKDKIISIGGNCGGEVKQNTYARDDIRIAGYGEPNYTILNDEKEKLF